MVSEIWTLVPKEKDMNVGVKWVFKVKYKVDNTLRQVKS